MQVCIAADKLRIVSAKDGNWNYMNEIYPKGQFGKLIDQSATPLDPHKK